MHKVGGKCVKNLVQHYSKIGTNSKLELVARFEPMKTEISGRVKLDALVYKNVEDYTNNFNDIMQHINDMRVTDQILAYSKKLPQNIAQKISLEDPTTLAAAQLIAAKLNSIYQLHRKLAVPNVNTTP